MFRFPLPSTRKVGSAGQKYGSVMLSLNGTLKKSGSVGRWDSKQFIGMALLLTMNYMTRPESGYEVASCCLCML